MVYNQIQLLKQFFQIRYKDGIVRSFHTNGQQKSAIHYQNGKKHGLALRWNESGALVGMDVYENGQKQFSPLEFEKPELKLAETCEKVPTLESVS